MSEVALLHVTFSDEAAAARIGRQMVEERLAACVNLLGPCRSIYRWQGAVKEADEARALFKTTPALAEALAARIAELHDYDLPAIEHWPVGAAAAVADWVTAATCA